MMESTSGSVLRRDRFSNAAFEYMDKRAVFAMYGIDIRLRPLLGLDCPPANGVANVHDEMFKQNSLSSAVSFPERVNDIEVTECLGAGFHKLIPFQLLKPVCFGKRRK